MIMIEFHYPKGDFDCAGDYYKVWIKEGSKIMQKYGDHYHDKGADKAEAFIDGVAYVTGKRPHVKRSDVADLDAY